MLGTTRMTTILPVADLARARRFYGEALGLESKGAAGDGTILFACANGAIGLVQKPVPDPATHTSASFEVDDIAKEISELTGRGVAFEDYDLPGLKTINKVCVLDGEKAAWFKDPDGNILCLHEARHAQLFGEVAPSSDATSSPKCRFCGSMPTIGGVLVVGGGSTGAGSATVTGLVTFVVGLGVFIAGRLKD